MWNIHGLPMTLTGESGRSVNRFGTILYFTHVALYKLSVHTVFYERYTCCWILGVIVVRVINQFCV